MKKKPTIAEIAAHNERIGGHYFDRATLRFFGQMRRDFRVKRLDDGRIIVYAYAHRKWDISFRGRPSSLAEYNPSSGEVDTPEDAEALKDGLRA